VIATKMQRRVRISGTLVLLGLLVEMVSLLWSHPSAFIFFLMPGALLMASGILLYLFSLVSVAEPSIEVESNRQQL
jgi:hypothetical protein